MTDTAASDRPSFAQRAYGAGLQPTTVIAADNGR